MKFDAFDKHYPFFRALKVSIDSSIKRTPSIIKILLVISLIFLIIMSILVFVPLVVILVFRPISHNAGPLIFIFLLGGFVAVVAWMASRTGRRVLILQQFCVDNGLKFSENVDLQSQTGSVFNKGYANVGSNAISGKFADASFSLFDYQYTTGSGKNSRTYSLGVTQINLARKFPHILLDNKKDNSISGFEFDRSQKLELEGGFNEIFNVYGPKEYEIEVLQILNPHVMSALIDMPEAFDIEIIGDKLYIYNFGHSDKKKAYQAIFSAIEQLTSNTRNVQQTFIMPEQIGNYRPILKHSIWPKVISIGLSIVGTLIYLVVRILSEINMNK